MFVFRRHLAWLVGGWLACQFAGIAAAPVMLWRVAATHEGEVCDCPLAPGAVCPMHHTLKHDGTCKMRNAFGGSAEALLALAGGNGVLPPNTVHVNVFQPGEVVGMPATVSISRAFVPDAPPPRA